MSLSANPSLSELQAHVAKTEEDRGFNESTTEKCLLLGEEVGELFKAIRASSGLGVDPKSRVGSIGAEIADVMFFLVAIANRCGVDLAAAVREKDRENSTRTWKKKPSSIG